MTSWTAHHAVVDTKLTWVVLCRECCEPISILLFWGFCQYLLHEDMVVVRLHVLQFPVHQSLVNWPDVICRGADIWHDVHKLLPLVRLQYVRRMWHIVFISSASWRLQPNLLPHSQVLHVLTTSRTVVHTKKRLQYILAQVLLTVHDV